MTVAGRARDRMVADLRASGRLRSPAVEDAFKAVPRHLFLPELPVRAAYADEAVAVQHIDGVATSSASQPSMMAIMLEQLDVRPGDRVLEIGAGTGYNAALMARIAGPAGSVTTVDIDRELVVSAADHLAAARVSGVELVCADGALGYAPSAPYDRIVLTVGSSDVRPEWVAQLAPGGRLLLPLAVRGSQLSVALDLGPDGLLRSASVRGCAFIRLRGVGAAAETVVPLDEGVSIQVPQDVEPTFDAVVLAAALGAPGPVRPAVAPLGPQDVWDGFGLWLALTDHRAVRLLALVDRSPNDPDGDNGSGTLAERLAARMFPTGRSFAAVGVVGPGPGVALATPCGAVDRVPTAACVRAFGPDGSVPADRLLGAIAAWDAAGRPEAGGLQLLVAPRSLAPDSLSSGPLDLGPLDLGPLDLGPLPLDRAPGGLVAMPHAVVAAFWPAPPAPAG